MIQHGAGICCKGSHAQCNAKQRAKTTQVLSCSSASISSTPSIMAHEPVRGTGATHQPPAAHANALLQPSLKRRDFISRHPGHHLQIYLSSLFMTGPQTSARRPSPYFTVLQLCKALEPWVLLQKAHQPAAQPRPKLFFIFIHPRRQEIGNKSLPFL